MAHQCAGPAARAAGPVSRAAARRLWHTHRTMTRRNRFREPGYGWPSLRTDESEASPAERALAALKVGAILAAVVTIVLIYLSASGALRGRRDLPSLLVVAAFTLPSLIAWVRAWYERLRHAAAGRRKAGDEP
jgi:hypothetical protein